MFPSDVISFHVGQRAVRNSLIWKEFFPKQEQRYWSRRSRTGWREADSHSGQSILQTDNHWKLCQEEKCVCEGRVNLNDTYAGMEISYCCNELAALLSVCPSVIFCSDFAVVTCLHKRASTWSSRHVQDVVNCYVILLSRISAKVSVASVLTKTIPTTDNAEI